MANTPSPEEVKAIQEQNAADHQAKVEAQRAEGKTFTVPADGHSAGVLPEDVWKGLPGKQAGGTL